MLYYIRNLPKSFHEPIKVKVHTLRFWEEKNWNSFHFILVYHVNLFISAIIKKIIKNTTYDFNYHLPQKLDNKTRRNFVFLGYIYLTLLFNTSHFDNLHMMNRLKNWLTWRVCCAYSYIYINLKSTTKQENVTNFYGIVATPATALKTEKFFNTYL